VCVCVWCVCGVCVCVCVVCVCVCVCNNACKKIAGHRPLEGREFAHERHARTTYLARLTDSSLQLIRGVTFPHYVDSCASEQ
jgi:hypothetical protein